MLVQMIRLFGIALFLNLISCSGGNFTENKKTASTEKDGGEGDAETADEPVMVGGAYLSCFVVSGAAAPAANNIGCAVKLKSDDRKASLLGLTSHWSLTDQNGSPVSVPTTNGSSQDSYHKMFSYNDDSYKNHNLELALSDNKNGYWVYKQSLSEVSLNSFMAMALFTPADGSKDQSTASPGGIDCLLGQESSCLKEAGAWAKYIIGKTNNGERCRSGVVHKPTIDNKFGPEAVVVSNISVTFNPSSSSPCIYNYGDVRPYTEGGCFIVPVNLGDGKYHEYFVSPQSGVAFNQLTAMSQKFQCVR